MAISYLLAPIPKWVIIGNDGLTAGGAQLYTYSSLNKVQPKAVYQDSGGVIPWSNPIIFDANGTEGPFYWKSDTAQLSDTYYLEVYDSDNNLLWTLDNYFPPGEGGGGTVTSYLPLRNIIKNNVFIDHIDNTASPIGSTNLVICPSNHHGFTPDLVNPVVGDFGVVGPDIRFVKDNSNATDQITFELFPLGSDPLIDDITPVEFIRYRCTGAAIEAYKSFQFPICQKVKNLNNQDVTFTVWAKTETGTETINLFSRQYFGSGGTPSAEVRGPAPVGVLPLTTTWNKFNIPFVVPNTALKVLGDCGDDALYLQLDMPLNKTCNVLFTKPALYVGTISPQDLPEFDTYDEIDSITQTPRTGDIKHSLRPGAPSGWLPMNDKTIGSLSSGATGRANIDTFFLFKNLWDGISNVYAPVSGGARGASAVIDFAANRTITLTRALGRVLSGSNPDTYSLVIDSVDIGTDRLTLAIGTTTLPTGTPVLITSTGTLPSPLLSGVVYYVLSVSPTQFALSLSPDYAYANIYLDITTTGSGTITVSSALGSYLGEGLHILSIGEMPAHNHPGSSVTASFNVYSTPDVGALTPRSIAGTLGATNTINTTTTTTISSQGGGAAHDNVQPTLITNCWIKL